MIYNTLNPMKAKSLAAGKYADGQGLWLVKRNRQAGKWVLRLSVSGQRREMGLGPWPEVSIADARAKAIEARAKVRDGFDPVAERQKVRLLSQPTSFAEVLDSCFKARQAELKRDGEAGRWLSPLKTHIVPKIGSLPVTSIDQHVLKRTLDPIWNSKAETAQKALGRIGIVLKHAAALGLEADLQATMKARALLGKQRRTRTNIPALRYQDAPAFYQWLCSKDLQSCFLLRFLMLTACRTGEARFATTEDLHDGVLVIPPERTKTGKEHKIPLAGEVLRCLADAHKVKGNNLLFPSAKGRPLSDATMSRFMEREGYEARPHGLRATFRSWAEECTDTPFEVKEACLGHAVDLGVVGAYQRGERLEKRLALLRSWEGFLLEDVR